MKKGRGQRPHSLPGDDGMRACSGPDITACARAHLSARPSVALRARKAPAADGPTQHSRRAGLPYLGD